MSDLPDEVWRRIMELGVESLGLTYKDLCCLSISCSRLCRLCDDNSLWSLLLSSDFNSSHSLPSKSLYRLRFEKERHKQVAAHRRALLWKQSQAAQHSIKIADLNNRISDETNRATAAFSELSHLRMLRQASVALKVWQPEVIRGRHKQMVEQNVVPLESRIQALKMELALCNQQILGFERAQKDAKQRLDVLKQELSSMTYHPLKPIASTSSVNDQRDIPIQLKKLKRGTKGDEDITYKTRVQLTRSDA